MTTKYDKSKELLGKFFKKNDKVGTVKLTELIMVHLGGDHRTVSDYMKVMMTTKLIKDIGNCHWRILCQQKEKKSQGNFITNLLQKKF